jgi:hypothetical protein
MKKRYLKPVVFLVLSAVIVPLSGWTTDARGYEAHPLIRAAIRSLEAAKGDLERASHDYCGHRAEALAATNAALSQLGLAIACDEGRRQSASSLDVVPEESAPVAVYERHPNIHKAVNALERAKGDLQNAAHDYCGHRVEALEATNAALRQLGLALQCDK